MIAQLRSVQAGRGSSRSHTRSTTSTSLAATDERRRPRHFSALALPSQWLRRHTSRSRRGASSIAACVIEHTNASSSKDLLVRRFAGGDDSLATFFVPAGLRRASDQAVGGAFAKPRCRPARHAIRSDERRTVHGSRLTPRNPVAGVASGDPLLRWLQPRRLGADRVERIRGP